MKDFIALIKRVRPEWLIYKLSEISIDMFMKQEYLLNFQVPIRVYGHPKKSIVTLSAWDIQNIEFLSICNSNDYRQTDKPCSLGELVELYRNYENNNSIAAKLKDADLNGVFRLLMGMTAEQFQYQSGTWIFDTFNRNYHILLAASNFEHRAELNIDDIVQEVMGFSVNDYISVMLIVFWLCMQDPDPLTVPEELYRKNEETILTKENIMKFVDYYSCNYKDIRTTSLGKQLLYSKPFIRTDHPKSCLASNFYLIAMLIANGLYWIVRDYYRLRGDQKFTNDFGHLFEDYIKELATTYCKPEQWHIIPQGKEKGADFFFDFGCASVIIESKSNLMGLGGKQQVPNTDLIDKFMNNTIDKAYKQLQSSYNQIKSKQKECKTIIKVILLYDDFSNTAMLQQSMTQIFDNDPLCFIMTIREFEILLNLFCYDNLKCQKLIECLVENDRYLTLERKSFTAIYDQFSVWDISHFKGELDYFSQSMERLAEELKLEVAE